MAQKPRRDRPIDQEQLTKFLVTVVISKSSRQGNKHPRKAFETIQDNLNSVEATLEDQHGNLTGGLLGIQTCLNSLAMQVTLTDQRVGNPIGFGLEYGVTYAFDAIRHLCKIIESIHEEFSAYVPYPV